MYLKNPQEGRLIIGGDNICILWFFKIHEIFQPFVLNHHFISSKIVEGDCYVYLIWQRKDAVSLSF